VPVVQRPEHVESVRIGAAQPAEQHRHRRTVALVELERDLAEGIDRIGQLLATARD
jgi:hypothetical protein